MIGPRRLALLAVWLFAPPVVAQDSRPSLPLTGSLIYNAIVYNRAEATRSHVIGLRFAGRVGVHVAPGTYVGVGVGSWARVTSVRCQVRGGEPVSECAELAEAQSEAVVHQVYVQQYVTRRWLFIRGGVGLAPTRTLIPRDGAIGVTEHWRAALTSGLGVDIPLAPFLFLSPSVDFTILPGAQVATQELRSGLATGLAITVR